MYSLFDRLDADHDLAVVEAWTMPQIAIDELPQPLQKLLRQAKETSSPLTITQAGQPFAVVYPAKAQRSRPPFGFMQGTGEIKGDIVAPVEQDWDVLQ